MKAVAKILPYLKPYRRSLALALAGTLVFTLLSLLPPLVMRYLMDHVIRPHAWNLLFAAVLAVILVPVTSVFVQFLNTQLLMQTSRRFIADMRLNVYHKLLALSMRFHTEQSSGAMVGRMMDDINMLQRLISHQTVQTLFDLVVFISSLSVAFHISWKLGLILVAILFLYVIAYRHFSARIREATQSYRSLYDLIAGRLQETISGVRQVRIYNREEYETEMLLERMSQSIEKAISSRMSSVGLNTACSAISGYGSCLVASMGAYFVLRGEMTYGDLLAMNSFLWMAMSPAVRLTSLAAQLEETFVSVGRILQVLDEPVDIKSPKNAPNLKCGAGHVEFRNIDFSYVPERPLYQKLTLVVQPGTSVALVGHTGCGKTTLTSLLMRHWDVNSGSILIDGIDIRTVNLRSLRNSFGVVLQKAAIFDATFAENIAYGHPRAARAEIEQAAMAAEIYDLALRLPNGFDTQIGTQGVKLSVGEKQRLSIARAILKDPRILIMDEATSALDSESELLIQKSLEKILKGRTSFIIAHRLSTIEKADVIIVMDEGRIIESGRHGELLANPQGRYRRLYEELFNRQMGGTDE